MSGDDGAVHYSRGRDKYDAWPEQREAPDFESFARTVLGDQSRAKGGVWISGPLEANSDGRHHRCASGALPRRFLALDLDGSTPNAFAELCMYLGAYYACGYTTASHCTKSPHARFILELSRPVDRGEGIRLGEALQRRIEARLGSRAVKLDPSVYRGEQPLYLPLTGAEVMRYYGDPIDVDAVLKDAPPPKERPGRAERAAAIASGDPVVRALTDRGMIKRDHGDGKLSIVCPFEGEHTEPGGESSTVYFLPNFGGVRYGRFHCLHAHCKDRQYDEFLIALGLRPKEVWRAQAGAPYDNLPPVECYDDDARRHTVGAKAPDGDEPGNSASPWGEEAPRPLQRDLPPATPFPADALASLLGGAALKMHDVIQAPLAICGNSVLSAAALAVQAHADVVIDGRVFPVSEMFLTIGLTGERKSTCDRAALWPHRKHERALCAQHKLDRNDYECQHAAFEKARAECLAAKQNRSYNAKRAALQELGPAPLAPLDPMLLCEEPTYEGLVKLLAVGQPSVGLFTDEGGRFIGGYGMSSDNMLKTAAGLSGLWDGKAIDRVRVGDGAAKLFGRRVSCHLMAQPEVSGLLLSNDLLLGQGLLSRFLAAWPDSTAGTRMYREQDLSQSAEITRYNARILNILESPLPLAKEERNVLVPRELPLRADAKALWVRFHDHIEQELADGGGLASIRGLGNKAPEHAARLGGTLALTEDLYCAYVTRAHIEAGIHLATHYLNEALRLYEAGAQDPDLVLAQRLLAWLKGHGKRYIGLREIYQLGPNPIRTADKARASMAILQEHGYVDRLDAETARLRIGGREGWVVLL